MLTNYIKLICKRLIELVYYLIELFKLNFVAMDKQMQDLLYYHRIGTENIRRALSIDESSDDKDEAVRYYKQGIEEFLLGLAINLSTGAGSSDIERGIHIQEKMENNLRMALERVETLNANSTHIEALKNKFDELQLMRHGNRSSPATAPPRKLSKEAEQLPKPVPTVKPAQVPKSTMRPTPHGSRASNATTRPSSTNMSSNNNNDGATAPKARPNSANQPTKPAARAAATAAAAVPISKKLKIPNVEDRLVSIILDEIVDTEQGIKFSDIAGQEKAKQALQELVILPALNPELFTGLRSPIKGLLLFGPPGNGKTMLAKAVANEANCKFFNISSASLTSKYVGEGEKLVRALFAVALYVQPTIIFIDEIDSILCERKENDHEASRRLKTEFLTQFDGMQSNSQDRILVMGATNRPFELDNAALRRFPKRIYIGLPDFNTRVSMLDKLLALQKHELTMYQIKQLALQTEGYSGSDLTSLAKDAALGPIRERSVEDLKIMKANNIRPLNYNDFKAALSKIRQSTNASALVHLENWNREFGDVGV